MNKETVQVSIYKLIDANEPDVVRYIGITVQQLNKRLVEHNLQVIVFFGSG